MNHGTSIFAKFTGEEILLEQGRLLFALLNIFTKSGYKVYLYDNLEGKQLDKYGQLVYSLKGVELTRMEPPAVDEMIYLYDREDPPTGKKPWRKKIQIRFDLFAPFWLSNPIIIPFPMHPLQAETTPEQIAAYRAKSRRMRVFFSGDTNHYGRNWVRYPRPKLARLHVINAIKENLPDQVAVLNSSDELQQLAASGYANKCVLTGSSDIRIEPGDWLSTLAMADFFLSPPGIVMPMCHNIIEAMAVGTIPITNYAEWLDPNLKHMENCIVFDDAEDLVAKMKLAMQLDPGEIERMRASVIQYYEAHMRPDTFVQRVEAHPDRAFPILMYTERNMAKNQKKLNRHSILMHGTVSPRAKPWFVRLIARLAGSGQS
jgi:hypothetical protein